MREISNSDLTSQCNKNEMLVLEALSLYFKRGLMHMWQGVRRIIPSVIQVGKDYKKCDMGELI